MVPIDGRRVHLAIYVSQLDVSRLEYFFIYVWII